MWRHKDIFIRNDDHYTYIYIYMVTYSTYFLYAYTWLDDMIYTWQSCHCTARGSSGFLRRPPHHPLRCKLVVAVNMTSVPGRIWWLSLEHWQPVIKNHIGIQGYHQQSNYYHIWGISIHYYHSYFGVPTVDRLPGFWPNRWCWHPELL